MSKKKKKKQKSKSKKKQSTGLIGMMSQMEQFTNYTGQKNFRAQISGKDYGPSHGQEPMTHADLMGGKKLVMTGKDKGKII